MKDAIGNDLRVGDTVVYINRKHGGSGLSKGVIVRLNKKQHRVQPLRAQVFNHSHPFSNSLIGPETQTYPDGTMANPADTFNVDSSRLVVINGEDWPEYREFLRAGWIEEPLDSL